MNSRNDHRRHNVPSGTRRGPGRVRGFTLIEAIILLTIMTIVAVAAGVGLQSTVRSPKVVDNLLAVDSAVVTAMEQKRADAMTSFSTLAGYTDTVSINGTTYNRTVAVSALTAPDGSGATTDYKQISVTIGNQTMVCQVTQP